MNPVVFFVAGVIAGMALILVVQAVRRPPVGSEDLRSPTDASVDRLERAAVKAIKATFTVGATTRTIQHETFQIRDERTGTVMNIADGSTTIETGGQTYHRLADVPEPQRSAIEEELHRIESLELPELVRDEVRRVLAAQISPSGDPPSA